MTADFYLSGFLSWNYSSLPDDFCITLGLMRGVVLCGVSLRAGLGLSRAIGEETAQLSSDGTTNYFILTDPSAELIQTQGY